MFGLLAFIALIIPWAALLAMPVLIWLLRERRPRALVATAAWFPAAATQGREFLYAIGLGLPYPEDEAGALVDLLRTLFTATEWYTWQCLAIAAIAAALLSWPLPDGRGRRALAIAVVAGLGVAALALWSFKGMRFI